MNEVKDDSYMLTSRATDEQLLTTKEAAQMIGLKPGTLERYRSNGISNQPPYIRVGQQNIRYRRADLAAWLTTNRTGGNDE